MRQTDCPSSPTKADLAAGIAMVLANRALLRARLRTRHDGWRCAAGLVLRGENASFVLSTFGLKAWSDWACSSLSDSKLTQEHVTHRFAEFMAGENAFHHEVDTSALRHAPRPIGRASYTFAMQPWIDGPARFVRPDDWSDGSVSVDSAPLMNVVCRMHESGIADLWFRFNHVGIDGVPAQEMVSRLEQSWGAADTVEFPTHEQFAPHAGPRPLGGREGAVEVQTFVDFSPVLAWRKKTNARLFANGGSMTFSAAFMWLLAGHPRFADLTIGTTAEMPATDKFGPGVGVIVARPADYPRNDDGLIPYVRRFNRELERNRIRATEGCKTLDAAALLSPALSHKLLQHALNGNKAFGSLGLTILKDARVFGAPLGDYGHPDGFIAIGSVALNAPQNQKVGCVHIKGPASRVADYPSLLREMIQSVEA